MNNNSTYRIQDVVDDLRSFGDLAPALPIGGYSTAPALSIANDTATAMLLGGPNGEPIAWKWNSFNVPTFCTNSYQQDYFVPGLVDLGWIESAWSININQTNPQKDKRQVEVHRQLMAISEQAGRPGKICWMQNSNLLTGTWGQAPLGPTSSNSQGQNNVSGPGLAGTQNPGPGVVYTNPIGQNTQPINATTAIKDSNGNFWVLTTYGTCGNTQPTWPDTADIVYPTKDQPNLTATTVTDGSVVWTAVNPVGQGFRLNPVPPQGGTVYVIQVVAQARPPKYTSLSQKLDPIPDDFITYFKQGFAAQCYRRNPDAKVRARFNEEWTLWLKSLNDAVRQGQREIDDFGFYPTQSIMDGGYGVYLGPAYPYPSAWSS